MNFELFQAAKNNIVLAQKNKNLQSGESWQDDHFRMQIKRLMQGLKYDTDFLIPYIENNWVRNESFVFSDTLHQMFSINISEHGNDQSNPISNVFNLHKYTTCLSLLDSFCKKDSHVAKDCFAFLLQSLFNDEDYDCYHLSISGERHYSTLQYEGVDHHNLMNDHEFYYCLSQAVYFAKKHLIEDLDLANYLTDKIVLMIKEQMELSKESQCFFKGSIELVSDYLSFDFDKKEKFKHHVLKSLTNNSHTAHVATEIEIEFQKKELHNLVLPLQKFNKHTYKI